MSFKRIIDFLFLGLVLVLFFVSCTKKDNFTVRFEDWDGTILKTEIVTFKSDATPPQNISRDGYTFIGWDNSTTNITSSLTITARYSVNYYTITWVVNGVSTQIDHNVAYGSVPTYLGYEPERSSNDGLTYLFKGWVPSLSPVNKDITYYASFDSFTEYLSVTYLDFDGDILEVQSVSYASDATPPAAPHKDGYTFTGWDTFSTNVTESLIIRPIYTINYYTVSWVSNGTVIETTHNLTWGEVPSYNGSVPTKNQTAEYTYVFDRWNPVVVPITGNTFYNAVFTHSLNSYEVTFLDYDLSVLDVQSVFYGSSALIPTSPSRVGYSFEGWDILTNNINGPLTVHAVYTINYYTVSWVIEGIPYQIDRNLTYGVLPIYLGLEPTKSNENGFSFLFKEWSPSVDIVTEDKTYTATFESFDIYFSVVFKDFDGYVLDTQSVNYGGSALIPTSPSRDGYTFKDWDTLTSYVTESLIVSAVYTINYYTVSWVSVGIALETIYNLTWGEVPSYNGLVPTKNSTAEYTYSFSFWSPAISPVTEDITYNAVFDNILNYYTLTFLDYDGYVLDTQSIGYGSDGTEVASPSREGYTFYGWDNSYLNITEDTVLTAVYNIELFFIEWVINGQLVKTDIDVPYNSVPSYSGDTPTKPSDAQFSYIFVSWSPVIVNVTSDATYYANFEAIINYYTITFLDYNETVIEIQSVPYGTNGAHPIEPFRVGYTFNAWDASYEDVRTDLTINALYEINYYNIDFIVNGNIVKTSSFVYNSMPSYNGDTPTKPSDAEFTYTFFSWSPAFVLATENTAYTAIFNTITNYYVVTFLDWDESILDTQSVAYGTSAVAPTNLYKEGYDFYIWDKNYSFISESLVVNAVYTIHDYLIVYKDFDGSIIFEESLPYQSALNYPPNPNSKGEYYYFKEWNSTISQATEDITITAVYLSEFYYLIDGNDILIRDFTRTSTLTDITIPQTIDGYNVKSIMSLSSSALVNLVVPNWVEYIYYGALENCVNLETISVPFVGSGTNKTNFGFIFGAWTYDDNSIYPSSLKSINITGSTSVVKAYSFYHIETVASITFASPITYIEDGAFEGCTSLENFNFSTFLTTIGARAFYGCASLDSADISQNTITLGAGAFAYCTSLVSFSFPSAITSISDNLFKNCINLTNVTLPSAITSIGNSSFEGCYSFSEIVLGLNVLTIGAAAYAGCNLVTSVTLPESVVSIGFGAFEGLDSLVSLTTSIIGDKVSPIDNFHFGYIFGADTYLENSLYIPESLETVNVTGSILTVSTNAFYGCLNLVTITLPSSITTIGAAAFRGCSGLVNLSIPFIGESLTSPTNNYLSYMFGSNSSGDSSFVPTTLRTVNVHAASAIAYRAFYGCANIVNINISSSFTSIGTEAFRGCSNLSTFNIPSSVTTIANRAFYQCLNLDGIVLPYGLTV
ncbi:MAG: leucine-rich repeat protein, partial [Acholeplasmatales bacterium]|nr:leucine-rich repeat protein [Acholeplasmatales bacterium]